MARRPTGRLTLVAGGDAKLFQRRWAALPLARVAFAVALVFGCLRSSFAQTAPISTAPPGSAFSIQETNGATWLVRPDGARFFSLGVCCVTMGTSPEDFDPDNPSYAAFQFYPDSVHWTDATVERLRSWGFTTVGAWSDFRFLQRSPATDLAFAPVLQMGSTSGAPWWDMWDPQIIQRMDQAAREQILAYRNDPRLLGYYTDNELGWWNAALFKMTLEQAATSGQRQRLIQLLRQTYHSDWPQLLRDFEPEGAGKWSELEQHGMLYLRPGGKGIVVMRQFLGLLADRYYALVHDTVRKYDTRALLLGDRYQSFFYPEVAQASTKYLDAVSINLNAPWNDGTFPRFYLETLHAATRRPVVVSEFYMASRQNRSGNQNDHGTYPLVDTQKERAVGFRNTLLALLRTPYVVGADWFQYYDEPLHGRPDGENFDFGLVDIYDKPYQEVTAAAAALDLGALKEVSVPTRPDASGGVPLAPKNPFGTSDRALTLQDWNRERGFIKPSSALPMADLYVCWDRKAVYLGLYSQDIVEPAFYRSKMVPKSDRAQWIVSIPKPAHVVHARLGAGMEPIVDERTVRVVNRSGLNQDTANLAVMQLPARLFGRTQFKAGERVEFSSTLFTHCRAYRMDWQGDFPLQAER